MTDTAIAEFPRETGAEGRWDRQESAFRNRVTADGSSGFPAEAGGDLYQRPGVAETVDFDHIRRHYYETHDRLNPSGIVPKGPELDLEAPPGREALD